MKKRYIIDANVIFSALIGGKYLFIDLFQENEIWMPDFAILEIQKYKERIIQKTKLTEEDLKNFIFLLFKQLHFYPLSNISSDKIKYAMTLVENVDEKDLAYIALVLELDIPLITKDKKLYEGVKSKNFDKIILLDDFFDRE